MVRGRPASLHFRAIGEPRPLFRICAPADQRLVFDYANPRPVPRLDAPTFVAEAIRDAVPALIADGADPVATTRAAARHDVIEYPVDPADATPKRLAYRPCLECHRIGAWAERGILGTRLGLNRNGGEPS